ncbi:MAG: type 2 fimbrial subunit [Actinobacteria bacterium]|nr:MAG: type 2 fimbrial subunit [Actinomycetota bacterium]
MSTTTHPLGRRIIASAGVLSLGLIGLGAAANAADEYGNIDPAAKGKVVLHKHVQQKKPIVSAKPDGTGNIPSDPVEGVEFTLSKVDIDLTTPAGWEKLSTAQVADDCSKVTIDGVDKTTSDPKVVTTGANGIAEAADLPVAAYAVCETSIADAKVKGEKTTVVKKAAPFLVTVPFPDSEGDGKWLYTVHAYPKNSVATVKKSIAEQTEFGLGSVVKFPVTAEVPTIAGGDLFKYYWVQDQLDDRFDEPAVESVKLAGTALVEGEDYTVVENNNKVTMQLTNKGLAKLWAAQGEKIETVFTGKVARLGTGNTAGVIQNTASVYTYSYPNPVPPNDPNNPTPPDPENPPTPPNPPTDPENPPNPPTPSDPVTTNWGDARVLKYDANDSSKTAGLAGAKFKVFQGTEENGECTKTKSGDAVKTLAAPEGVFTANKDGLLLIDGLYVSDSVNAPVNADHRCYVLEEVEAPAGYVLPAGDDALTPLKVKIGLTAATLTDVAISNTKQEVPQLPITGANGEVLMLVGGASFLLLAAGGVMVTRRRAARS